MIQQAGDSEMRMASRLCLLGACIYIAILVHHVSQMAPMRAALEDLGKTPPPALAMMLAPELPLIACGVMVLALLKEWMIPRPRATLLLNGGLVLLVECVRQFFLMAPTWPLIDLVMGMK